MSSYQRAQKLLGPWSPALALKERVEREAEVMWALQEVEPFEIIPPLKGNEWPRWSAYTFGRGVYRQIKSVMP